MYKLQKNIFNPQEVLTEASRAKLTSKSRIAGRYKKNIRGINRWERKRYSKVANQIKAFNKIDMNQFFKQDILTVAIPVSGETADYTVTVQFEGVVTEIAKNIKNNKNKFEYRTIIQSLTRVFNTADIKVKCTCPDFQYTFQHVLIISKDNIDGTDKDPGPGKGIRNPNDDKGRGCKHILLILDNLDWLMRVANVIDTYIKYTQEHLHTPFVKIIFPKLYGVSVEDAQTTGLIPQDININTEKHLIEVINKTSA